jgi:hypothetical protein
LPKLDFIFNIFMLPRGRVPVDSSIHCGNGRQARTVFADRAEMRRVGDVGEVCFLALAFEGFRVTVLEAMAVGPPQAAWKKGILPLSRHRYKTTCMETGFCTIAT